MYCTYTHTYDNQLTYVICVFFLEQSPECGLRVLFCFVFCAVWQKTIINAESLTHKNSCRIYDDKYTNMFCLSQKEGEWIMKIQKKWENRKWRHHHHYQTLLCVLVQLVISFYFPFYYYSFIYFSKSNHVYEMRICVLGSYAS